MIVRLKVPLLVKELGELKMGLRGLNDLGRQKLATFSCCIEKEESSFEKTSEIEDMIAKPGHI
jgi:hypothetical protein